MTSFIYRFSVLLILTTFALTLLSFVLAHLFPGDILANLSGETTVNDETRIILVQHWALDNSLVSQFLRYCQHMLSGEWGVSMATGIPVHQEIGRTLPATLELCFYALVLTILIGVPLGCIAGVCAYTKTDYTINAFAIINYSMPVFWLGLALIILFSLQLEWLPLSGRISILLDVPPTTGFILIDILVSDMPEKETAFKSAFAHLALPAISVAIVSSAALIRLVRRSVVEVLNSPFIAAARSRGLSPTRIFFAHVIRNALMPILPLLALLITTLITNTIIVESLFSWPGIGHWLLQGIYQQDYTAIRVGILVVALNIVVITIAIDLLNRIIDPSKRMATDVSL